MDRGRDRLFLWLLLAHVPLVGLVAFVHDPSMLVHALGEMAIFPVLAGLAYWHLAGTRAFRCVGAVLLMGYSGLLIHLSGGMIELHFHVFVGMALLIVYFDWLPISIAAVTIALHHLVLNFVAPAQRVRERSRRCSSWASTRSSWWRTPPAWATSPSASVAA